MKVISLRAHHLLCMSFYEGKGYSESFVKRVNELTQLFASDSQLRIKLKSGGDMLCESCPHFNNGICGSADKSDRYDAVVASIMGDREKAWEQFQKEAKEKLFPRLKDICGDCAWFYICERKSKESKL